MAANGSQTARSAHVAGQRTAVEHEALQREEGERWQLSGCRCCQTAPKPAFASRHEHTSKLSPGEAADVLSLLAWFFSHSPAAAHLSQRISAAWAVRTHVAAW